MEIRNLVQDDKNFNKGTARGKALLSRSFEKFGAGRPICIDKNNRIIAGNKSAIAAEEQGINNVVVVETDGTELVVVKRNNIDLDSGIGREFALVDNVTAKQDYALDYDTIMSAVDELKIDTEAWGIKDAAALADAAKEKAEKEQVKKEKNMSREDRANADTSPVKFKGFFFRPSKQENDDLLRLIEDYYNENGVVIGFMGELLGI